jgi:hypothetical protein
MPGSFPGSATSTGSNKENKAPVSALFKALPHGIMTKKRHRVSTDEEDAEREAEERAAKKRKDEHVPEGEALLAPRLLGVASPSGIPTPNKLLTPGRFASQSAKKKATLSLSRLNMLARPKLRK